MSDRRGGARIELIVVVWVAVGVLAAMVVLAVFRMAESAMTAVTVGVLVALALDPVVRIIQRRAKCSRAVATLLIALALAAGFATVLLLLGPSAVDQAGDFASEVPDTIEELYSWPLIGDRLEAWDAVGRSEQFVDDLPARLDADTIESIAQRVLGTLGAAVIVLVTAIAVLLDGESMVQRVRRTLPEQQRERADHIGAIVYRSVARYFAGSLSVALLNGFVILTAGLILGVPLAPLAAVWAAITNLIPQIGGFLGGSFFVVLATTQGAFTGLIALVIFLAYQQFENNVIQPTVIGRAVNLTPPTTMLAALIGGAAAGVPGALVATPLLGAAKSVWLDVSAESARDSTDDVSTPTG